VIAGGSWSCFRGHLVGYVIKVDDPDSDGVISLGEENGARERWVGVRPDDIE